MISVMMLTYNREKLVGRAIESILNQTYPNFELIIVDNGSSDRSGEIADSYAAKDARVRVIHRERGNIGAGRNTAMDAAQGEYMTFIDDDDWVEPDFLEFLVGLLEENGADVSICGTDCKSCDDKNVMTAEEALVELMWRKKYNAGFPTKLFRRELLTYDLRFSEQDQYDDIDNMYRLLAKAKRVAYHGKPQYHVVRHGGNNSAWTTNHELLTAPILDKYLLSYRSRTEWLGQLFPSSRATFQYFEWSFMISMVEKINRLHLEGCGVQLQKMTEELKKHHEDFLRMPKILDFEKEWMQLYVLGEK